ncbi:hypothetical protein [uncultured Bacteroides sp.]|uniref:hypothetical protein n=2 Tax=uncultured Bacteroides sp. TaxID=162156 RepID=UPI0025D39D97|nr:hypothetical protein [uncultured Bacteroides sp.]
MTPKGNNLNRLRKYQILAMLDRYEEALDEREKAANLLPPNDASRLEFYGFKYKLSGDTLQSNEYYLRALAEYDKQIANNENAYITKKVTILIYLDRIIEAKETLQLANQKNPKDEEIKTLLDNVDSLADEFNKEISTIRIKLKK